MVVGVCIHRSDNDGFLIMDSALLSKGHGDSGSSQRALMIFRDVNGDINYSY